MSDLIVLQVYRMLLGFTALYENYFVLNECRVCTADNGIGIVSRIARLCASVSNIVGNLEQILAGSKSILYKISTGT